MRFTPIILAASLVLGTAAFAQPIKSGIYAPSDFSAAKKKAKKKKKAKRGTSSAVAGPNNSTGNMNTKGTGKGTTGTGGPGGSGNR